MAAEPPPPAGGPDAANGGPKQRGRPFKPGQSGNPRGTRAGSRNKATLALDALAAGEASDVLRATLERAKAGDTTAAALVLSRVWPARKGRPVRLDLPEMRTPADLALALGAVAGAVARAELSPEEGAAVAAVLETQRRAIETAQLEQRIAALEAAQPQGGDRG